MSRDTLYQAFGLQFTSELPLPELLPGEGVPDVRIRCGRVPWPESEPTGTYVPLVRGRDVFLHASGYARAWVRDGREIVVEAAPDADEDAVRLFLLSPALAALLHQRGYLVLHASAVAIEGSVAAFLGESGQGKSTLAAMLNARGWPLVSDDLVALPPGDGLLTAFPGFPRLKLCDDAVVALGLEPDNLPMLSAETGKRARPVEGARPDTALPLRRIFCLTRGGRVEIQRLRAPEAMLLLIRNTFRKHLLDEQARQEHFRQCESLAATGIVRRLVSLDSLSGLTELAAAVEADARAAE